MLFSKQPRGKQIALSASFITNPLKIVSLSLVRLFLVLAVQSRPFLHVAMFSFHLNKLLHILVVMGVLSSCPYCFKISWNICCDDLVEL